MFCFNKTTLAILSLSSTAALAGTMGPACQNLNATIPCKSQAWSVGIEALYLKPISNNGPLSSININEIPNMSASSPNFTLSKNYQEIKNDLHWGFRFQGAYQYKTGSDINLNWSHLQEGNELRYATPNTNTFGSYDYNAINLELGQLVQFGEDKQIRFHAGLQYSDMSVTPLVDNFSHNLMNHQNLTFHGIGPRVGADMGYHLYQGLSLYGNFAASLLLGQAKYNSDGLLYAYYSDTTVNVAKSGSAYASEQSLVPEIEAKVGVEYSWIMQHDQLLTLNVGYMAINYFNALHQSDIFISTNTNTRANYDFGLAGPYLGAKWVGNL